MRRPIEPLVLDQSSELRFVEMVSLELVIAATIVAFIRRSRLIQL